MKTLLFHSYKGGSGKTLISSNVANILASEGYKTLLIEADFTMPSFQNIYPEYSPDVFFNDYLNQNDKPLDFYIYPNTSSDFGLIFCSLNFKLSDNTLGSDQDWYLSKIDQLDMDLKKLDYDFVLFDSGPGFNLFLVNTLVFANEIVLVTRPDYNSFRGITFLLDDIYSMITFKDDINFSLVFNQIPEYPAFNELIEQWIDEVKIKFPFIQNFHEIEFDAMTNYLNATRQIILPSKNPIRKQLENVIHELINGEDS